MSVYKCFDCSIDKKTKHMIFYCVVCYESQKTKIAKLKKDNAFMLRALELIQSTCSRVTINLTFHENQVSSSERIARNAIKAVKWEDHSPKGTMIGEPS